MKKRRGEKDKEMVRRVDCVERWDDFGSSFKIKHAS
jgi:hypothetical protein